MLNNSPRQATRRGYRIYDYCASRGNDGGADFVPITWVCQRGKLYFAIADSNGSHCGYHASADSDADNHGESSGPGSHSDR